jgi:hypothetical protein
MLRDLIHQLLQTNLAMVQIMAPTIEMEYGAETGDRLVRDLGEQLRGMLQQLETLSKGTSVQVVPSKVQLKPRRRA